MELDGIVSEGRLNLRKACAGRQLVERCDRGIGERVGSEKVWGESVDALAMRRTRAPIIDEPTRCVREHVQTLPRLLRPGTILAHLAAQMRASAVTSVACVACILVVTNRARADEDEPKIWEQLFFPFPIVGAPPQLEQQVQLFNSYFRGNAGSGDVVSAEVAYILSPHLGIVATVPVQFGFGGQTTGLEDIQVQVQGLAAGSLKYDDMLSVGITSTLPTGHDDLSGHNYFFGLFAYGAQRFFHHLIFEGNVTVQLPFSHGDTARQFLATGLVSVLLTPRKFDLPIYVQCEVNSTTLFRRDVRLSGRSDPGSRRDALRRTRDLPRAVQDAHQRRDTCGCWRRVQCGR